MEKKKLIEVALPLEEINKQSAREKSIRHGHPSTLHLWWARRPLAAARAVIWSSLVDDPSAHPEQFPTEEEQSRERERLFDILRNLVVWENSNDEAVLNKAKAEIMKSTGGNPPALLDPFAGGGAIPLEAQRLGLEAHAHDLNPVAVTINKAMIEIPPRFAGRSPVNPEAQASPVQAAWRRAAGLAEDVRYYGEWMKQEAFKRIGHLYPKVKVPREQGGGEATVIAWIWARTVKCPNPACGCEMPLAGSFVLSKKKGHEAWIEPVVDGENIRYVVHQGKCPKEKETIKSGKGANFACVKCGTVTEKQYIHDEFTAHRNSDQLIAIVAEGKNGRVYISPTEEQVLTARSAVPAWAPEEQMNTETADLVSGRGYGITMWKELFTNRQLTALTTFSELVAEAQAKAEADAIAAGMENNHLRLRDGGDGAKAYGEAVGVYLAFAVDRASDAWSSLVGWRNSVEASRNTFARQALPMVWDYTEVNPFSASCGNWSEACVGWIEKAIDGLNGTQHRGEAKQFNAQSDCGLRNIMVSTDPPYYDNIGYADLSDYFYVWLRQSLKDTYPALFSTMLVPKNEELVAVSYRHEGNEKKAKRFFEDGMLSTCKQLYKYARDDIPVTIYYAYKQSDTDENGTASSGWETMLGAIVNAGFAITGTWPMRTERPGRMISNGTNALASSIVLVCRKRPEDAPQATRRELIARLRRELRPALQKLQGSSIAPVDLAQSAIGPGMGVFSRYSRVLEADGTVMSVRSALQLINAEVDAYFNEQVGGLDAASRFCVDLYTQYAFNDIKYGEAQILANAKNTSIEEMAERGFVYAKAGIVRLVERAELPEKINPNENCVWLLTQQLTQAMKTNGVEGCAKIIHRLLNSDGEPAKELAYRLYDLAERKGWTEESYAYNALVASWQPIQSRAAEMERSEPKQDTLF